jgi:hypothetical protein
MKFARAAFVFLAAAPVFGADGTLPPNAGLTVHEWGTFTSVAMPDGAAAEWNPLGAAPDLPCFVMRRGLVNVKSLIAYTVRMETPVLYFYSKEPRDLSVQVGFNGTLTEWYPKVVDDRANGSLQWKVKLLPGPDPAYPVSAGASHYFAARKTDATPLRAEAQDEKMIFYRGAGWFKPPVTAMFRDGGQIEVRSEAADPLPFAALFENRDGKVAFRVLSGVSGQTTVAAPETGNVEQLKTDLAAALAAAGMYPKEAAAMIETWRDSWFEHGSRLFYIVPRSFLTSVLPLNINPKPTSTERAFVGRVELMPDWRLKAVETAAATGDVKTLEQEGRFLKPLLEGTRMLGHWNTKQAPETARFLEQMNAKANAEYHQPGCVQ